MTILSLVQHLKALVEIDNSINKIQSAISDVQNVIEQDHRAIETLKTKLVAAERSCINARKELHAQEVEAESLQKREEQKRAQLDLIHNQKELNSLQKEIDSIARQRNAQEDDLLKAWHAAEATDLKLVADKKSLEAQIAAAHDEIKNKQESQKTIALEFEALNIQRADEEKNVSSEWLTLYERMRKSVPNPIVPMAQSSCSICYYGIPPQDLSRLRNNEIVPCKGCYRLLYREGSPATAKPAEAPTT